MKIIITPTYYFGKKVYHDGKSILYCRVRVNRRKSEFATGIKALEEDWDYTFRRSSNDKEVNNQLSTLETKLQEIVDRLYFDNKNITSKILVDLYKGKNLSSYTITEYFDYYLYDSGRIKILAKGYSAKFVTLKGLLHRFTKEKYKSTAYDLRSIDFKFLTEFDNFLKAQKSKQYKRSYSPTYIQKNHSMFRTVLISAFKQGIIKFQPYQDFTIREVRSEIKYLSVFELERLKNLDLSDHESLEKVRDIFLFSVYTGLRFNDSQNVSIKDIEYENHEPKYLIKRQEKTKDKVEIPILHPTLDLINKYKNTNYRRETGRLMPKFSNTKLNAYLKAIGDLANIKLKLTHHVARHTCATTVLLENDVPINEVSKWLGHAEIKSTNVYAHVTRNKLGNTANRLNMLFEDK